MNAATGIYVSDEQVFVTGFKNDRVLIYDLEGTLQQTFNMGLEKPTNILLDGAFVVTQIREEGGLLRSISHTTRTTDGLSLETIQNVLTT